MTTEKKPEAARAGRMVRCPAHVHDLMEELRALMAEQGHQAYWRAAGGKVVHGNVEEAPLHIPIAWALTTAIEILHPDREEMAAAHEARENYLASFEDEPEDVEE